MRKILWLCFILLAVAACKKDNDVTPSDPATAISGTYDMNRFQEGSIVYNLPATAGNVTVTGALEVTKATAANTATLVIILRATGQSEDRSDPFDVEVRRSGNDYELYEGATKIGTANGTDLTLDFSDAGTRYVVNAKKR